MGDPIEVVTTTASSRRRSRPCPEHMPAFTHPVRSIRPGEYPKIIPRIRVRSADTVPDTTPNYSPSPTTSRPTDQGEVGQALG